MRIKNENNLAFNSYLYAQNKKFLSEAEQVDVEQNKTKQKVEQGLASPKAQEAMTKQAQEWQAKYKQQIEQALAKDGGKVGPTVEALLKQIEAAAKKQALQTALPAAPQQPAQQPAPQQPSQQIKQESLDLREGIFGRAASRVSGALKSMSGGGLNARQQAIVIHFQKLQKNLGSHLRELQRDMETTSGVDNKVKTEINNIVGQLQTADNITPTSSKFQDFRHKAGKFVQNVATGALLAAPIVALATPLAAAMGLVGPAAAAVSAGLTGGSVSMLKDLITGQKPDAKRAVVTGLGAAVAAGLFSSLAANADAAPSTPEAAPVTPEAIPPGIDDANFETMQGSSFDPNSTMDARKYVTGEILQDKGIMGTAHDAAGNVVAVQSPIVQNFIDTLGPQKAHLVMRYIDQMDPATANDMLSYANRQSGSAITSLAKAVGDPRVISAAKTFLKGYR